MDGVGCCGMLPDSTLAVAFVISIRSGTRPVEIGAGAPSYPKKRLKIR